MFSSTREVLPSLKVVYVLLIVFFVAVLFRNYFNKLKTKEDYLKRASNLGKHWKQYDRAAAILKKGLDTLTLTEEEQDVFNFQIGMQYYYKRDYKEAVEYFEKMERYFKKARIPFDNGYLSMIVSYYNIGKTEKAKSLYHILKKQQKLDSRYGDLDMLEKRLFEQ